MLPRATTVVSRLRGHRGLWALAVFALVLKLVSGTVCLADRPSAPTAAPAAASAVAHVDAIAVTIVAPVSAAGDGLCGLGEGSGCHCACAHSMALPIGTAFTVLTPASHFVAPTRSYGRTPHLTGSPLRPPIV